MCTSSRSSTCRDDQYTDKEVCNKIDTYEKGKAMYVNYQKKGETGKDYT